MTLAERFKLALQRRDITQADLARLIGVAQPSVNNWATGETKSLRADVALKAAKELGVRVEWLIAEDGPMLADDAAAPTIQSALPVVLDAIASCPHRDELRTLLALLVDHDAPAYRARLGELLGSKPLKPPVESRQFLPPVPEAAHEK